MVNGATYPAHSAFIIPHPTFIIYHSPFIIPKMAIYLLESALCLACFYGFYHLALRRETFFQWSRAYLLIAPLLAMLLPALHIRVERDRSAESFSAPPPVAAESFSATQQQMGAEKLSAVQPTAQPILPLLIEQAQSSPVALHRYDWSQPLAEGWSVSLADALWAVYGLGAAVLLGVLALRFGRLLWLLRRCRRERQGSVTFATSEQEDVPLASFFGYIFWNKNAQLSESQQLLLEHELVHVRQRHSLDVLLMELMVVLQWFNPLMHAFRRSLCAVHEYIADDCVVRHTRQRRTYATLLVQQAAAGTRAPSGAGLVNTFHSLIKQRLIMLAKRPSRPLRRLKFALALPLAAGLMLLFSFRLVETLPAAAPLRAALESAANYAATLGEVTVFAEKTAAPVPPAEPEPTPYIFYWGTFQCAIFRDPATDAYFGQVNVAPAVFRESVQREPRLWDGSLRTMMASCQMRLHNFNLRSDWGSPDAYTATLKTVNDFAYTVLAGETVRISELTLPNGKTASIEILIQPSSDGYNGPRRGLIYNNSAGAVWIKATYPEHKSWGAAIWDYAATQDFITESEFWFLMKKSPLFVPFPMDTLAEIKREMTIVPAKGDPVELRIEYNWNEQLTFTRTNLDRLAQHMDLLKPGTKVYFESPVKLKISDPTGSDKPTETMSTIALLQIVADDDPRLPLGRAQRKSYSFEWGKLSRTVGDFYGVSQTSKDGAILPTDSPMGIFHYEMGLPDVFKMFEQTPHLWRMDEQLKNARFTLEYKDLKATYNIKSGFQPADFPALLKSQMKPDEQLVIGNFEADGTDLRTLKVILVPHEGLLKPLLPRSASPQERQRFLAEHFSVSPNPATDRLNFRFTLPEAGYGILRISNALGQEVYSVSTDFAEGETTYPLLTSDLKAKGQFFATLEMPFGKTTLAFVVQ